MIAVSINQRWNSLARSSIFINECAFALPSYSHRLTSCFLSWVRSPVTHHQSRGYSCRNHTVSCEFEIGSEFRCLGERREAGQEREESVDAKRCNEILAGVLNVETAYPYFSDCIMHYSRLSLSNVTAYILTWFKNEILVRIKFCDRLADLVNPLSPCAETRFVS